MNELQRNKGIVKRTINGYLGRINIENVRFDVQCTFWSDKKPNYLWLQRCKEKRFDSVRQSFVDYNPSPTFECIAYKTKRDVINYRGEFMFVGFKYNLVAWFADKNEKELMFEVERCESQPIIKRLNELNKENNKR